MSHLAEVRGSITEEVASGFWLVDEQDIWDCGVEGAPLLVV